MTTPSSSFQNLCWQIIPAAAPELLAQFPELESLAVQLLQARGVIKSDVSATVNQRAAERFLTPDYATDTLDPFLFRDMRQATDRIFAAITAGEPIMMFGDYDADGVSAAVIMVSTLQALGARVDRYLPHRETEGYGMNLAAIEKFSAAGIKIIISGDCGIANVTEIKQARDLGMDVIVTDHHTFQSELPPAYAIIHPGIPGEPYPDKTLCGGGVAFKLAQGLLRHPLADKFWQRDEPRLNFEKWLVDMVAISSVADMVPLLGETRVLTWYGLKVIPKSRRPGLRAMLANAGLTDRQEITSENIAFQIAPRINAAGRMDHANAAYELLMTQDAQVARTLADALESTNQDRQRMTEIVYNEALELARAQGEQSVYIVASRDWPLSIAGLVAGKLAEMFNRPCFVLTQRNGFYQGSGRGINIPGVSLMTALDTAKDLLAGYGGHPDACGLKLPPQGDFAAVEERLRVSLSQQLAGRDLRKTIMIDAVVRLDQITWELYTLLEQFAPYGYQNPTPRYLLERVTVEQIRPVGTNNKHLQLFISQNGGKVFKTIGFSCGTWCDRLAVGDQLDLVIELNINEWNGNRNLELKLIDGKKTAI